MSYLTEKVGAVFGRVFEKDSLKDVLRNAPDANSSDVIKYAGSLTQHEPVPISLIPGVSEDEKYGIAKEYLLTHIVRGVEPGSPSEAVILTQENLKRYLSDREIVGVAKLVENRSQEHTSSDGFALAGSGGVAVSGAIAYVASTPLSVGLAAATVATTAMGYAMLKDVQHAQEKRIADQLVDVINERRRAGYTPGGPAPVPSAP